MSQDLSHLTKEEMEVRRTELQIAKRELIRRKQAIQSELGDINSKCVGRIPNKEFKEFQTRRGELVINLNSLESEMATVNDAIQFIQQTIELRKEHFEVWRVKQIVAIRDKWHAFSMDSANHKKARETAWAISQELREVLKGFFVPNS